MDIIDIATSILSRSAQRLDISAQNVANMTVPGYKARKSFADILSLTGGPNISAVQARQAAPLIDFTPGKTENTGNPFDLAISGSGFFVVRSHDGQFYTRNGQFRRDADGRLITAAGLTLQSVTGDFVVGADAAILSDGTVLDDGEPVARLNVVDFADPQSLQTVGPDVFASPDASSQEATDPQVRQGMLETANVSAADEMVSIMATLRGAESGQRIVQTYDDLMARAITTFGQL
jgi:flagellar basal-body rod protein FlgG